LRKKIQNKHYVFFPDYNLFLLKLDDLVNRAYIHCEQPHILGITDCSKVNIPLPLLKYATRNNSKVIVTDSEVITVLAPTNFDAREISQEIIDFINENYTKI